MPVEHEVVIGLLVSKDDEPRLMLTYDNGWLGGGKNLIF